MNDATYRRLEDVLPAPSLTSLGGWTLALGSLSVVFTSLFYVLSPPLAVAQVVDAPDGAMAAAAAGAHTMRIAGTCGVFGNLVMAIGAVLLAIERAISRRAYASAGWAAIVMSILVFEIVDCLTGFVLSPAAQSGETATFEAFRSVFAVFFLVGTAFFGAGAILVLFDAEGGTLVRWLARFGLLNGLVGVGSVVLTFAGWPFSPLVGASVGVGAILFVFVGSAIARGGISSASPPPDRASLHPSSSLA